MSTAIVEDTINHKVLIGQILESHRIELLITDVHFVQRVDSSHSHQISSEGTSLISDNLIGTAHSFGGLNLSNQAITLLHLGD